MDGAIENFISFCKAEEEKFAECYHRKKSWKRKGIEN